MELFFSPLACSLATRIALYEAGLPATFTTVTLSTKRTGDGRDYFQINPKGQVPALQTDDGTMLTEGPAVLQYVADLAPDSSLAPAAGTSARYALQTWLNYIATEVHKQIFAVMFNPTTPKEAKAFARQLLESKLAYLDSHLADRETLLGADFTVADAYLVTALNWCRAIQLDLAAWPALAAYQARHEQRPAVARAMSEEAALWDAA